jgi:tetratricopeptide (TPR) repeat protein
MRKLSSLLFLLVLGILLSGCENSNIFSWTHPKGKDKSAESLMSDAQSALINGDYDEAVEYYTDILDKDPDNSEALYGLAAAELKDSGLDIAALIPKFIEQGEDAAGDLLSLNVDDIESGTASAIEALKKIADGSGDGDIPADDFDVNLNLGIALTMHAASNLLSWAETTGAVEIKDDFSVDVNKANAPSEAELKSQLIAAKEEIEDAVTYIEVAANTSGSDVSDVTSGFNELISNLDTQIAGL